MDKLDHTVTFTVNKRGYLVELMPPLEALEYAPKVTAVIVPAIPAMMSAGGALASGDARTVLEVGTALAANPEALISLGRAMADGTFPGLMKTAMAYVRTADGTPLGGADAFNQWFRKYPQDMLEVASRAVWEQVREYLSLGLNIADAARNSSTPAPTAETTR